VHENHLTSSFPIKFHREEMANQARGCSRTGLGPHVSRVVNRYLKGRSWYSESQTLCHECMKTPRRKRQHEELDKTQGTGHSILSQNQRRPPGVQGLRRLAILMIHRSRPRSKNSETGEDQEPGCSILSINDAHMPHCQTLSASSRSPGPSCHNT
jgi:hypothetical protein